MQTPDHTPGFHCQKFDSDLLQQVIAIEVDMAVRRVCAQRGICPEDIDQHQWIRKIMDHLEHSAIHASRVHALLPSDIDTHIDREISHLIDHALQTGTSPDAASAFIPVHGLFKLPFGTDVFLRHIFKKHIE